MGASTEQLSSFRKCRRMSRRGVELVKNWLESSSDVRLVEEVKDTTLQRTRGDLKVTLYNDLIRFVEVKTEQENRYGNFFFETQSNQAAGKTGWLYVCECDDLVYMFDDQKEAYLLNGPEVRAWAHTDEFNEAPEKTQGKWDQKNKTLGRPHSIKKLQEKGLAIKVKIYENEQPQSQRESLAGQSSGDVSGNR